MGQRSVGVVVAAVDVDLRAGLGPDLAAHPAGKQRADGQFDRRFSAVVGPG